MISIFLKSKTNPRARLFLTGLIMLLGLGFPALSSIPQEDDPTELTVHVSGSDHGVIEPCGCTDKQFGGIGRRAFLLETATYNDNPHLILSTGDIPGKSNDLHLIRFEIILLCMDEMGYSATGLGPKELSLGLSL